MDETQLVDASQETDDPRLNVKGDTKEDVHTEVDLEQRKALGGEINRKYAAWRQPRRVHELQWFL